MNERKEKKREKKRKREKTREKKCRREKRGKKKRITDGTEENYVHGINGRKGKKRKKRKVPPLWFYGPRFTLSEMKGSWSMGA